MRKVSSNGFHADFLATFFIVKSRRKRRSFNASQPLS